MIQSALGRPPRIQNPSSIHTFPDHLTLAANLPGITAEALAGIQDLRAGQRRIARELGIQFHATASGGSTGICHTVVREEIALPGQVILGTDSHTCSAGALNCLAYGIGNTEIACVWEHNEIAGRVPHTVRIRLSGKLRSSCTAKDVILQLAHDGKLKGTFTGKVMEFCGPGLAEFSFEEQAVLSNMAVECNALTAIMEPTEPMIRYLIGASRPHPCAGGVDDRVRGSGFRRSTRRSNSISGRFKHSLPHRDTQVMAFPSRRSAAREWTWPMRDPAPPEISPRLPCMRKYWPAGMCAFPPSFNTVPNAYVRKPDAAGFTRLCLQAGVQMIEEPGCGACINAGPGGPQRGQVAISATNRNMPGRMGEGDAYLANPYVVAASAVQGRICGPEDLPPGAGSASI